MLRDQFDAKLFARTGDVPESFNVPDSFFDIFDKELEGPIADKIIKHVRVISARKGVQVSHLIPLEVIDDIISIIDSPELQLTDIQKGIIFSLEIAGIRDKILILLKQAGVVRM